MDKKKFDKVNKRLAAVSAASSASASGDAGVGASKKKERLNGRQSIFKIGKITLMDRSEVACVIKDISATGARVIIQSEACLPPRTVLRIESTGEKFTADLAWQNGREAGLKFEPRGR